MAGWRDHVLSAPVRHFTTSRPLRIDCLLVGSRRDQWIATLFAAGKIGMDPIDRRNQSPSQRGRIARNHRLCAGGAIPPVIRCPRKIASLHIFRSLYVRYRRGRNGRPLDRAQAGLRYRVENRGRRSQRGSACCVQPLRECVANTPGLSTHARDDLLCPVALVAAVDRCKSLDLDRFGASHRRGISVPAGENRALATRCGLRGLDARARASALEFRRIDLVRIPRSAACSRRGSR